MADDGRFLTTRLTTAGGLKYKQMQGYPTVNLSEDGVTAQEQYLMKASDLLAFVAELSPLPYVDEEGRVQLFLRRSMPGNPALRTTDMSAAPHTGSKPGDPFNLDSGAPADTYDPHYVITLSYSNINDGKPDKDPKDPKTFLERSITSGGEFLSIGPQNTETGEAPLGSGQETSQQQTDGSTSNYPKGTPTNLQATADAGLAVVKFIPTSTLSFKWPTVPRPPWTQMFQLMGTVNGRIKKAGGSTSRIQNQIHRDLFFNAEPETVLYTGFTAVQKFLWIGTSAVAQPWDVTLGFTVKRVDEEDEVFGWNHVWVPKEQKWKRLYRSGEGGSRKDLYELKNHLNLFVAGTDEDEAAS